MKTVIPLSEATIADSGPKMGRLGELFRQHGQVPDGFVITAAAADSPAEELTARVAAAYERLCGGKIQPAQPVVVRSSAVDEDGDSASFAGVYDSVLGVLGVDEIMPAVRACWAAAHSERAAGYRHRMGARPSGGSSMAVGVMLMVPARASGVAFTVDPVTGRDDRFVIEATVGFGEPVVQGVVTPDRIEVAADDGRILRYEPGDKRIALRYDEGRMSRVELPSGASRDPALTEEDVTALFDALQSVLRVAGHPVDCEWVLDHSGRAWIVQWRSVTALPDDDALEWDPAEYAARYAFRSG